MSEVSKLLIELARLVDGTPGVLDRRRFRISRKLYEVLKNAYPTVETYDGLPKTLMGFPIEIDDETLPMMDIHGILDGDSNHTPIVFTFEDEPTTHNNQRET